MAVDILDCCPVAGPAPLKPKEAERVAAMFKVLGDPARLRLLSLIATQPDLEACVCDLQDPIRLSQPTVSHHLKVLHDAGFLTRQKRGTWAFYRVVPEALQALSDALEPARI